MSEFFTGFASPDPAISLIVQDDGRVAYAYLLIEKKPAGDVWLYNQAATPAEPEWRERGRTPYLNPEGYTEQPPDFRPIASASELDVKWLFDEARVIGAELWLRGARHAIIRRGEKPGASRFASQDGPLARVLPS